MGLGENCDKFQLQVKIKKVIEKQGYRVLALCSNVLGGFLGMENLPGFLYSKFMSYPEKIIALNHWIHTKVKTTGVRCDSCGLPWWCFGI